MEDHWTGIDTTRKSSVAMLKRQIMIEKRNHLQNVVIGGGEASCGARSPVDAGSSIFTETQC